MFSLISHLLVDYKISNQFYELRTCRFLEELLQLKDSKLQACMVDYVPKARNLILHLSPVMLMPHLLVSFLYSSSNCLWGVLRNECLCMAFFVLFLPIKVIISPIT